MTHPPVKKDKHLTRDNIYGFYNLDARHIKEVISETFVDVIITSPPYADMKDYGIGSQIGHGQTYEEYLKDIYQVFKSCYEISKNTATLWMIIDTFKKNGKLVPLPFDVVDELDKIGWILQDVIIWNKTKTLPYSRKGQLRNIFEYILFFSKTSKFKYYINRIKEPEGLKRWWVKYPERYNPKGKNPSNIWTYTIPTQGTWSNGKIRHHCPLPPELIERILLLTTNKNNVVMDPFAGSGIVLAQAYCMKRKYIGLELNGKYVEEFFNGALLEVERRWEGRVKELKKIKSAQNRLERKIERLRKLKFSKIVVQKIIEKFPEVDVKCVLILDNGRSDGKYLQITKIIIGNKFDKSKIKKYVETIVQQKPLSKFEIQSIIEYVGIETFHRQKGSKQSFYLYLEGRFNYYKKRTSITEFIRELNSNNLKSKKLPPIVSDIHIRQKIPKDDENNLSILDLDF